MDVRFQSSAEATIGEESGNIAVLVRKEEALAGAAAEADRITGGSIRRLIDDGDFQASPGKCAVLPFPQSLVARALVVAGCGEAGNADDARKAGAAVAAAFGKRGGVIFAAGFEDTLEFIAELALGAGLRAYRFERHKTDKKVGPDDPPDPEAGPISIVVGDVAAAEAAFSPRSAALAGTCFTRDLVNEPANVLGTVEFSDRLAELASLGVEVEVLGEAELEEIGMRTLLAVGRGSERESRVVVMRWSGGANASASPAALIGKGVVFDTGGISIKPSKGMEEMTMDMGGAGVVAGTMKALALRRAPANVVGIVGLVENMPDGRAQRPGDVVASLSGRTVEVLNTDAEGRLVLADLLTWAQARFKPSWIVDLATLTGAMMVSLGTVNAGYFANDEALAEALKDAARTETEGLWRMPLGKEYAKTLKSRIADIKNISEGPWGGAITAAEFLHAFVDEGTAWAHIDIAGVTLASKPLPLSPAGATGWGVRTLDRLVTNTAEAG